MAADLADAGTRLPVLPSTVIGYSLYPTPPIRALSAGAIGVRAPVVQTIERRQAAGSGALASPPRFSSTFDRDPDIYGIRAAESC